MKFPGWSATKINWNLNKKSSERIFEFTKKNKIILLLYLGLAQTQCENSIHNLHNRHDKDKYMKLMNCLFSNERNLSLQVPSWKVIEFPIFYFFFFLFSFFFFVLNISTYICAAWISNSTIIICSLIFSQPPVWLVKNLIKNTTRQRKFPNNSISEVLEMLHLGCFWFILFPAWKHDIC